MHDLILLLLFFLVIGVSGFIIIKIVKKDNVHNKKVLNENFYPREEKNFQEDFKENELISNVSNSPVEYELNENQNQKTSSPNPFITSDHIKQLSILTDRINLNKFREPLRNSNLQLRTEPINPQVLPGPFNLSTIDPDMNRRVNDLT